MLNLLSDGEAAFQLSDLKLPRIIPLQARDGLLNDAGGVNLGRWVASAMPLRLSGRMHMDGRRLLW